MYFNGMSIILLVYIGSLHKKKKRNCFNVPTEHVPRSPVYPSSLPVMVDSFIQHSTKFPALKWPTQSLDTVPLKCSGKRDLNSGCAVNQSQRIAECHNNSKSPNFKRVLPKHCRIHAKKNRGSSQGKSGFNSTTRRVCLIKVSGKYIPPEMGGNFLVQSRTSPKHSDIWSFGQL